MAALMKATIERDLNLPVKSTNKQKTISLKRARAMNQRPPALMGLDSRDVNTDNNPEGDEDGLNIKGLDLDNIRINGDNSSLEFQKTEPLNADSPSVPRGSEASPVCQENP
jgi:hypothetical protein